MHIALLPLPARLVLSPLKTGRRDDTGFGHSSIFVARHVDGDKLWVADGRTESMTLSIYEIVNL